MKKLKILEEKIQNCTKCKELVQNRNTIVFGEGNPKTNLMFLGEAPGQKEDEVGLPFVGRAGTLLTNLIKACNIERKDVYICNILKCRPPLNREPTEEEACNCRPFLELQIQLVSPKIIVCLGSVAAQNLLGITTPISYLRGNWQEYKNIKVMPTYHPAYLLRNPEMKKYIVSDMQKVIKELNGN